MMKENKRILDEELSKGIYVTYYDIADRLIKDPSDTVALGKIIGQPKIRKQSQWQSQLQ